jgi:hypothetical protein
MQMFGLVNARRREGWGQSDGSHSTRACRNFGSSEEERKWSQLAVTFYHLVSRKNQLFGNFHFLTPFR